MLSTESAPLGAAMSASAGMLSVVSSGSLSTFSWPLMDVRLWRETLVRAGLSWMTPSLNVGKLSRAKVVSAALLATKML